MPNKFSSGSPGKAATGRWWEAFNDPELNRLIEQALTGNFSLKISWARLRQTRALALQTSSELYPELTLKSGSSLGRTKYAGSSNQVEEYSLGLVSSYELDLWGRIRSGKEAATLDASATREDLNTAAMTLAASVTERWANIISQRLQKELLKKQLQINQTHLELVDLRFRKGMAPVLDIYQQKQILEEVNSNIPLVEAREQTLLHELALLLGKPPSMPLAITRKTMPVISEIPAAGLPADLLASRPDIRAAGLRLQSADWKTSAAKADRLPAIRLSGTATYGPEKLGNIFDNWLLNLAGNLAAPIFDGKRRAAKVDMEKAAANEKLWFYRQTVFTAVREVEDALVTETKRRQHIRALQRQMDAAGKALEQADQRYRKGLSDYLPVITQLLTVQRLEREMIQQQTELLTDRISLYRALGGTWINHK
ncbi:MAG: efflux transporter outer membrane subunit [Desulfobacterales bacterium]|nr:efflux transporter outer membrane subunit [Desulfobacterales bacterium]